jgi:hypothetical protein
MIIQLCLSYIVIWIVLTITNAAIWNLIKSELNMSITDYANSGKILGRFFKYTAILTFGIPVVIVIMILSVIWGW